MDAITSWDPIIAPLTMATIRANSEILISQIEFDHALPLSDGLSIPCRLYFTPKADPSHFSSAPLLPPAPRRPYHLPKRGRGRPSKLRLAQETAHQTATEIYNQDLVHYRTELSAHRLAVQDHELTVTAYKKKLAAIQSNPELLKPDCIFTHGADSQLDNPALAAFTQGFARTHTVLGFEDRGDTNHRAASFRTLLNAFPSVTSFGGRSRGSVAAVGASLSTSIKKLILFSYPLGEGKILNDEELLQLDEHTEVLFVGGDSDSLCHLLHLAEVRRKMKAKNWWIRIVGADHGIRFEPPEKRRKVCEVLGQIASSWFREDQGEWKRSVERTELVVRWDERKRKVDWTAWERRSKN